MVRFCPCLRQEHIQKLNVGDLVRVVLLLYLARVWTVFGSSHHHGLVGYSKYNSLIEEHINLSTYFVNLCSEFAQDWS